MNRTEHRFLYQLISTLLVIVLIIAIIPAEALAIDEEEQVSEIEVPEIEEAPGEENEEPLDFGNEIEDENEPFEEATLRQLTAEDVVGEDELYREENVKHFRLLDGSRIAVEYDASVHYEDTDGTWKDIDNRLQLKDAQGTLLQAELSPETDILSAAMDKLAIREVADFGDNETDEEFSSENGAEITEPPKDGENSLYEEELLDNAADEPREEDIQLQMFEDEGDLEQSDSEASEAVDEKLSVVELGNRSVAANDLERLAELRITPTENGRTSTGFSMLSGLTHESSTHTGKYGVEFSLSGANIVVPTVIEDTDTPSEGSLMSAIMLPNAMSTLEYPNILENVDLRYSVVGNDLKETIVINAPAPEYRYSFEMSLENLVPEMNEDGSISLLDNETGTAIYRIPVPFMSDADYSTSNAVEYALNNVDGTYYLTIIANADWINDEARHFPISIDPTIAEIKQGLSNADSIVQVAYICSGLPSNQNPCDFVYVGYDTGETKINRSLMRITQLPELPDNSVVVYGAAFLCQAYGTGGYSYTDSSMANTRIAAYRITSDYAVYNAAWNTFQDSYYNNYIVDYVTANSNTSEDWHVWNLTRLTKSWYSDGNNYGFLLKAYNESSMSDSAAAKVTLRNNSGAYPRFAVQYRNNVGLEDYYSYQVHDIGRAGTGYISDYSNQLTLVKNDYTNPGAISFDLAHVYNSAYSAGNFPTSSAHSPAYGMKLGYGWKLTAQQSITPVTLPDINGDPTQYLVYLDADGTEHYFLKDPDNSTKYKDEDGLGLTITVGANSQHTLSDEKGNSIVFKNGLMTEQHDANGNIIRFLYNNATTPPSPTSTAKLTSITQQNNGETAFTLATLEYNSNGYLISITDRAGRCTAFAYSGNKLITVTHDDGTTVSYSYSTAAPYKLLSAVDNESNYKIQYAYSDDRVSSIAEYGGTTAAGSLSITANTSGLTIYRYSGKDNVLNNSNDILTYCVFDYCGRTINKYNTDPSGNILGVDVGEYTENTTNLSTIKKNNKLTISSSTGVKAVNMITDSSMEDSRWTNTVTPSGTTCSITTGNARTGTMAQKVTISSSAASGATAKYTQSGITLTAGQTYTLSAYVDTTNVTQYAAPGSGVYLRAVAGSESYDGIAWAGKKSVNGWHRIYLTFSPTTTASYMLSVCYTGYVGTVYVDDIQLEIGSTPSEYNMLGDAGFELGGVWTLTNASYNTSYKRAGSRSVKITGTPTSNRRASQTVPVNLSAKYSYILSGWAKAVSVPTVNSGDTARAFRLRATITYTDNTSETHNADFCPDVTVWQHISTVVLPKSPTKTVSTITVTCEYYHNANSVYFDNISLVRDLADKYTYDDDGNVTKVNETEMPELTYTYSGADLIHAMTAAHGQFNYSYDAKHRVTSVANNGVSMALTYDAKGNTSTSTLSGTGVTKTIKSSATYTDKGNLLYQVTDSLGGTTTYAYGNSINQATGQPSSMTNPVGTQTTFVIDSDNGRPTMAYINGKISVENTYTNGYVSKIARAGYLPDNTRKVQNYNFTNNVFGQTTKVTANTTGTARTLATYTYGKINQGPTKLTYGNGQYVTYTYNNQQQVSSATYSTGGKYHYSYAGDGQVRRISESSETTINGINNVQNMSEVRDYDHDSLGRLAYDDYLNFNIGFKQLWRYSYTDKDQVKGIGVVASSASTNKSVDVYEMFTYNDTGKIGTLKTKRLFTGDEITYTYDGLLRTTQKAIGSTISQTFTYKNGPGTNTTTTLVETQTYKKGSTNLWNATYAYDTLGNITSVTVNGGNPYQYTYDPQLNYLTQETQTGGHTANYTYDTYGNITKVTDGSGATTKTFTYGNTAWLDLLTKYNGNSITYDTVGNPTGYYNGASMTWQKGRQLATYVSGGTTTAYTYDMTGQRVRKTVGSTVHDFVSEGGRVVADLTSNATLIFGYDESGHAATMSYNGTTYYYITNIQGDVLKIVNSSGTAVATYTYNAWGELLSSSGSLAAVNPIRYRSYYYDAETGFYYLQSRYYDPVICRFINADDVTMLGANGDFSSVNLFAYCGNNPIKNRDDAGTFFFTALGAVSGFIGGAVSALVMGEDFATAMEQGCAGAVGGAIAGAGVDAGLLLFSLGGPVSVVAAVGIAYFAGGFGNVVTTAISSEGKASGVEYVGAFIIGGTFNVLSLGTSLECAGKTLGDIALKGALSAQENMVVGTMISTASGVATSIGSAALKRADSVNRQGMVRMAQ